MTEPTPLPEWAVERAERVRHFRSNQISLQDAIAEALVAVRREAALECARYHDVEYLRHQGAANECALAGNDEEADHHRNSVYTHHRAAEHCRARADKEPT